MKLSPWSLIRRLYQRLGDKETHNKYLAETNEKLANENSALKISEQTLRMKVRNLERTLTDLTPVDDDTN